MIKKLLRNEKGFTFVELIVALSITSIITIAISSFLISNLSSFSTASDLTEIQHQAQVGINELSDYIRGTEGIVKLTDSTSTSLLTSTTEEDIFLAVFKNGSQYIGIQRDTNAQGIPILKINNSMTSLNDTIDAEFIYYIEEISMKPLQGTFSNCNAVTITMKFKKNDSQVSVSNEVYFRNK